MTAEEVQALKDEYEALNNEAKEIEKGLAGVTDELDDNTDAGKKNLTTNEKMVVVVDNLSTVLIALAESLGIVIPEVESLADAEDDAADSGDNMTDSTANASGTASDAAATFGDFADAVAIVVSQAGEADGAIGGLGGTTGEVDGIFRRTRETLGKMGQEMDNTKDQAVIFRRAVRDVTSTLYDLHHVPNVNKSFTLTRNVVTKGDAGGVDWGPYVPGPRTFQHGGDFVVSQPTPLMVGEMGAERVTIKPLSAGGGQGGKSVTINLHGPTIFDDITMSQFARVMTEAIKEEQRNSL